MSLPIVAVVGRPNVGKSTLFNKLIGQRLSIVEDTPGVTRDRIYSKCEWRGKEFMVVDTGGIEPESNDVILAQMRRQSELAIEKADVIVFVTDIKCGVTYSYPSAVTKKEITDAFSALCNVRVIWGGDATIAEIRKSPLPPRSNEITFADRHSAAVINADSYLAADNKAAIIRHSKKAYVVAEARKLSTDGNYNYTTLDTLSGLITDTLPAQDIQEAADSYGVEIILP